jgi:hypothetical protein
LNLMTATPRAAICVAAPLPLKEMTAGKGPSPAGSETAATKDLVWPFTTTFTLTSVLLTVPVTLSGLGGLVP